MLIDDRTHLDHGLSQQVIDFVRERFGSREDAFLIETVELPTGLPSVSCALHAGVPESEVFYAKRGGRANESRLCDRPPFETRLLTVVAGGSPCALWTAFGGPAAPKEPGDPYLKPEEREASEAFWKTHALSASAFGVSRS